MPPAGLVVLLVVIALPLTELALLIKAASEIGIWMVLAIIFTTAALGVWVMQEQGLSGFRRMQEAMQKGKAPLESMMDSSLRFFAGLCLIAPGLITDTLGLLLLLPPVRAWAARAIHDNMTAAAAGAQAEASQPSGPRQDGPGEPPRQGGGPQPGRDPGRNPGRDKAAPPVIEGDFERLDERPVDPRRKRDGGS